MDSSLLSAEKGVQQRGPHSCGLCEKYMVLEILSFWVRWPSCGACPELASALIRVSAPAHVEVLKRPWAAAPQVPPSWDKANYSLLEHHGPLPRWKNTQPSASQPRPRHHGGVKNDVQDPTCRVHAGRFRKWFTLEVSKLCQLSNESQVLFIDPIIQNKFTSNSCFQQLALAGEISGICQIRQCVLKQVYRRDPNQSEEWKWKQIVFSWK